MHRNVSLNVIMLGLVSCKKARSFMRFFEPLMLWCVIVRFVIACGARCCECGPCCCVAKNAAVRVLVCGLICGALKCHMSQSVG